MREESQLANDLKTFDVEDIEVPTADALQQIDAGELLCEDDMGVHADDFLIQDLGGLF